MWTLGWLICISKACCQANYLLLLGIREPWEGQCPPPPPRPTPYWGPQGPKLSKNQKIQEKHTRFITRACLKHCLRNVKTELVKLHCARESLGWF